MQVMVYLDKFVYVWSFVYVFLPFFFPTILHFSSTYKVHNFFSL